MFWICCLSCYFMQFIFHQFYWLPIFICFSIFIILFVKVSIMSNSFEVISQFLFGLFSWCSSSVCWNQHFSAPYMHSLLFAFLHCGILLTCSRFWWYKRGRRKLAQSSLRLQLMFAPSSDYPLAYAMS